MLHDKLTPAELRQLEREKDANKGKANGPPPNREPE
jgi:hypothetical protein